MGVYTIRSSDRPVSPTGLSDWSVRRSYRVNASSDRRTDGRRIKHVCKLCAPDERRCPHSLSGNLWSVQCTWCRCSSSLVCWVLIGVACHARLSLFWSLDLPVHCTAECGCQHKFRTCVYYFVVYCIVLFVARATRSITRILLSQRVRHTHTPVLCRNGKISAKRISAL